VEKTIGGAGVVRLVRAAAKPFLPTFTADSVGKQHVFIRQLRDIVRIVEDLHAMVSGNPTTSAVILPSTSYTAGSTTLIKHGLSRPYTGWQVIGGTDGHPRFYEVALDSGLSKSQFIKLLAVNTCTCTIQVY
jgi:hypothetical protein